MEPAMLQWAHRYPNGPELSRIPLSARISRPLRLAVNFRDIQDDDAEASSGRLVQGDPVVGCK